MKLMDKVAVYTELREKKDDISKKLKEVNGKLDEIEKSIIEDMDNAGLKAVKTSDGRLITTYIRSFVRTIDRVKLIEWLKRNNQESMLTVNVRTLTAFYNERLKNNDEVPPGVEQYTEVKLSFRKE